jgi:2-phospho-L-lactate guanylyltransferase
MQPLILIPCKSFAVGKSRLSAILSPERRDALCRSFLVNTVTLANKVVARDHIHIVSSDSNVASVASDLGVHCDGENDHDLNSALTSSVARIIAGGHENAERNILILPIDLALNSPAAIAPVIAVRADIVVVPDRLDQGTNLLRLGGNVARNFRFQYGDNSFWKHRTEAQSLGLTVEILRDPVLCFDVDTPADYAAWAGEAAHSPNFAGRIAPNDS